MWLLLNESGSRAVQFTSMLDIEVRDEGQALSEPIEQGSFASYNKVDTPLEIAVTLGLQGDPSIIDDALTTIKDLKQGTELVALQTPDAYYESLTLQSFSYTRSADQGVVAVELELVEVQEVETLTTTTDYTPPQVKNPGSASTQDTGKANTTEPVSLVEGGTGSVGIIFGKWFNR